MSERFKIIVKKTFIDSKLTSQYLPLCSSDFQVKFRSLEIIFHFQRRDQEHHCDRQQWKVSKEWERFRLIASINININRRNHPIRIQFKLEGIDKLVIDVQQDRIDEKKGITRQIRATASITRDVNDAATRTFDATARTVEFFQV